MAPMLLLCFLGDVFIDDKTAFGIKGWSLDKRNEAPAMAQALDYQGVSRQVESREGSDGRALAPVRP